MWVYADYLEVKKDFVPVFSEEEDRKQPTTWKFFIPHKGMRDILHGLIKALERGSAADRRSLWIHGAYGTGKTFVAFLLKHLLEDDVEEVENYFQKHQELWELWLRLKALKIKDQYLVVYRSSCNHITSSTKLLVEIQQAVKDSLRDKEYSEIYGVTIHDTILNKLTNPDSSFDWNKAFLKHRAEFIEFSSPEEVIDKLSTGDVDLTETVARVLESEGFLVIDDPKIVKEWLKELINKNSLQGIVFIWDEFTDFFNNNVATNTLQEIAHLTGEAPFYFLLITHKSPDYFHRMDEETRKRLLERFHNFRFEMRPVTAYQLIANAIEVKDGCKDFWDTVKESLWSKVAKITLKNLMGSEAKKENFRGLIPIHPFSGFLLATISRQFSSSQRTLFKFLKEEHENSFIQFLRDYPKGEWYWFTPDNLWDYFFTEDNPELTERVRDILGYYFSRIDKLDDENEKIAFKAIMLLIALWRQMPGEELLRPTRSKLELVFAGTPASEIVSEIAKALCDKGFINSLPSGSDEEYTIPLLTVDERKLEDIKNQLRSAYPFEKLVGVSEEIGKGLLKIFNIIGPASRRQKTTIVSYKDLKNKRERVEPELKPYEIGIVVVVVQEEEQLLEAEQLSAQFAQKAENINYIVVQTHFSHKNWEDWVGYRAHKKYSEDIRDMENAKFYDLRSKDLLDKWLENVKQWNKKAYFKNQVVDIADTAGYQKHFTQIVDKIFKYGPEQISIVNTLYDTRFGKTGAEIGLGINTSLMKPYKDLVDDLVAEGLWGSGNGFLQNSDHPISQMKKEVVNIFNSNENISLSDLWETMQKPPFGLMPSPISITLMGFLLKEYAQAHYWSDGTNCFQLNHNKLAELIESVMKQKKGYEDFVIRRMSQEDENFCQLIQEIFDLPSTKTNYPEEAKKALRNYISTLGYPFWSLLYVIDKSDIDYELLNNAIQKLDLVLSVPDEGASSLSSDNIKELVGLLSDVKDSFKELVKKEKFETGIKKFIFEKQPSLINVMEQLKIDLRSFVKKLKLIMEEEIWIWQEAEVAGRLPELYAEFELISAINQLCGIEKKEIADGIEYLSGPWLKKAGKLPLSVLAEANNENISLIIIQLNELISDKGKFYSGKLLLAEKVKELKLEIRQAIADQKGAIIRWANNHLETELSSQESEEIYSKLPELTKVFSFEEIKQAIKKIIDALSKRKLLSEVESKWQKTTLSDSPQSWSEEHRTPIQWVLQGKEFSELFDIVNKAETKSEKDLQLALKFMSDHEADLAYLNDNNTIYERFLTIVARDYKNLLTEDSDAQSLKEHLYSYLDGGVFNWPLRYDDVMNAVESWIKMFYQKKAYAVVIKRIDGLSTEQVIELLKLLAEDPLVGTRLLYEGGGSSA